MDCLGQQAVPLVPKEAKDGGHLPITQLEVKAPMYVLVLDLGITNTFPWTWRQIKTWAEVFLCFLYR